MNNSSHLISVVTALLLIFVTNSLSSSSSSSPSFLFSSSFVSFATAQQQSCDENNPQICAAGHAWFVEPNSASPTGCKCYCNNAWQGWKCDACDLLGSVIDVSGECVCNGAAQPVPWVLADGICKRTCNSALDCNGHGASFLPVGGNTNPLYPPADSCRCVCRNYWYSSDGQQCNLCPIQYAPANGSDCAQCANGFAVQQTVPVLVCTRPCNTQADCSGHARAVSGDWIGNVSSCKCDCFNQFQQPDCKRCPWPYAGSNCSECAELRDNYPDCIGRCNASDNCTGAENVEGVSRVGGQCVCKCRNEWTGPNATDCSVCPRHGVKHRDCVPITLTHELTNTSSTSLSATQAMSASSSPSDSVSRSDTPTPSLSESLSLSDTLSPSDTLSISQSATLSLSESPSSPRTLSPSLSFSESRTRQTLATVSGNTATETPTRTLSIEPTTTDTIVVCFMFDCGNGTQYTYYSNTSRRCICECRSLWQNETKCSTCPFAVNASLDCAFCALGYFNMTPLVRPSVSAVTASSTALTTSSPSPLLSSSSSTTAAAALPLPSTTSALRQQQSQGQQQDQVPAPNGPPGTCDCASHALVQLSIDTNVGVPASATRFATSLSQDIVDYLESRCFGMIKIYAIPYRSVVDLGSNTILSQIELIALTAPDMEYERCFLKPAATACLLTAFGDVSALPPSQQQAAAAKLPCIPTATLRNVTNSTGACFTLLSTMTMQVPYSPCANATQLACPMLRQFEVIPAPVPSWLWLILLIVFSALLALGIVVYCCWRYYPVFAAWRERKRKQEHEEMLLALQEAELEEKEAGWLPDNGADVSSDDEDEYDDDDDQDDNKNSSTKHDSSTSSSDVDDEKVEYTLVKTATEAKKVEDTTMHITNMKNITSIRSEQAERREDDDDDEATLMHDHLGIAYELHQRQQLGAACVDEEANDEQSPSRPSLRTRKQRRHQVNESEQGAFAADDFSYRRRPERPFFSSSRTRKGGGGGGDGGGGGGGKGRGLVEYQQLQKKNSAASADDRRCRTDDSFGGDDVDYGFIDRHTHNITAPNSHGSRGGSKREVTRGENQTFDDEVDRGDEELHFTSALSSSGRARTPLERLNTAELEAEHEALKSLSSSPTSSSPPRRERNSASRFSRSGARSSPKNPPDDFLVDRRDEGRHDYDDFPQNNNISSPHAQTPSGRKARQLFTSDRSGRQVWENLVRVNLDDI